MGKPRSSALLLASAVLASALAGSVQASVPAFDPLAVETSLARPDEADDQYQFIAGLSEKGLHDVVVKEARSFLQKWPRHAKANLARYRMATSLFELSRTQEASSELRHLFGLQGFEFAAEVAFRLGQCELALGRHAQASQAFQRVLDLRTDYLMLPARFFLGESQFRAGDFGAAEKSYEAVVKADPDGEYEHDSNYGLAWCSFRLAQYTEAVRRIQAFLHNHPRDPLEGELQFLLGEAFLASEKPKEALAAYGRVRDGDFADSALRGAAFALSAQGSHLQAAQQFETLVERFPESRHVPEAALHAGIEWMRGGDAPKAVRALDPKLVGTTGEAAYWRAQALLDQGQAEQALAVVDRALGAQPTPEGDLLERLHVTRGDALSDLGRGSEAVRSYGRSGSDYAQYAAVIAALNAGRTEEAVRLARSFLEEFKDSQRRVDVMLAMGEARLAQKRYREAEQAFGEVLGAQPEAALEARALARRGWCLFLLDDFAGAARAFGQVVERHADTPEAEEATFMAGRAHEKAGDAPAALRAFDRYVQRYPEGSQRGEALLGLARLGESGGSVELYERILRENPTGDRAALALFELGEHHVAEGETAKAAGRYRQLLDRFPNDANAPAASYGYAWCQHELDRPQEAAKELEAFARRKGVDPALRVAGLELWIWASAKAGDPGSALTAYRAFAQECKDEERTLAAVKIVGRALEGAGRKGEAGALYEELLGRVSRPEVAVEALVENAWIALDAGRVDEAESALRTALRVLPEGRSAPALGEAFFFVGEKRFDGEQYAAAAGLYTFAAQLGQGPIVPQALYKQGFAHLRGEDLPAAAGAFEALVASHEESPLYGEGLYLLGETRYRAGRFADAIAPLETLRKKLPKHQSLAKAMFRLGLAYGELERWKECEAVLAELTRRWAEFPGVAEAELWRGRSLAGRGDPRGARAAFERVVASDRGVLAARARIGLGELHLAAGSLEEALSEFLKVAVLYAHDDEVSQALFLAGACLERMNDLERAREQYREILSKYPKAAFAERARARLAELDR